MKASKHVTLGALAALSLAIVSTGCASREADKVTADCVVKETDGDLKIVDDQYCSSGDAGGSGYVWIYGASPSSPGYVRGGSYRRPPNTNISTRSGKVIVGGFGSSSKGGSGS